jgi:hypothetical protein
MFDILQKQLIEAFVEHKLEFFFSPLLGSHVLKLCSQVEWRGTITEHFCFLALSRCCVTVKLSSVNHLYLEMNVEVEKDAYKEPFPDLFGSLAKALADICSEKTLKKRLPILQWLPNYDKSKFLFDIVAGLSVALTLIPQGIAFAIIAGLPPQYGLYSSFVGSFVYTVFGSCKDVTVGPTAIMALLTYAPVYNFNADFAFLGERNNSLDLNIFSKTIIYLT